MRVHLPRISLRRPAVHPSDAVLGRYYERTLPAPRQRGVAQHLAACAACRDWLRWRGALADAAAALSEATGAPAPHAAAAYDHDGGAVLAGALRRRAVGERVLVPAEPTTHAGHPPVPLAPPLRPAAVGRGSRSAAPTAIAAGLVLAAALALRGGREAAAGGAQGELALAPAAPQSGDTLSVTYRPSAALAGAPRLTLRAVFHPADDTRPWTRPVVTAARLTPDADGSYRGRVVLPRDAAYARFAVEDSLARHVDAHGGLPWELIAHDAVGRPRMDGIRSRGVAVPSAEWERSRAVAFEATRVHPDHPSGWMVRTSQDVELAGRVGADRVGAAVRPLVARLDTALARAPRREPWAMLDLGYLAGMAGEEATAARWHARLLQEAPRSRAAYTVRMMALGRAATPSGTLDSLERWWRADPDSVMLFAHGAVSLSLAAHDTAAARRWAARYVAADPVATLGVARLLVRDSALADAGVAYVRADMARHRIADDGTRPLEATAAEWARRRDGHARTALAIAGEGLLTRGRAAEAANALTEATAAGWDGRAFRLLGEARLATGDTSGAVQAYAHAAADPIESARLARALPARLGARVRGNTWAEAVGTARRTMHARVLGETVATPVLGAPRLADDAGARHTLAEVAAGRVTVVAVVSRGCAPSLQDMPAVEQLSRALAGRPAAVVAVTREAPNDELRTFLREGGYTMPLWHDLDGEVGPALSAHGTPTYLVLDRRGLVRWRGHRIAEASPVVDALLDTHVH